VYKQPCTSITKKAPGPALGNVYKNAPLMKAGGEAYLYCMTAWGRGKQL
jgi:hypothetical protein